jgi:hypothetical protein
MNLYDMSQSNSVRETSDSPILLVPYMWIGDFVRCHTVVRLLKRRFPSRPIDVLTTEMVSPLLDYMPGVRQGSSPTCRAAASRSASIMRWPADCARKAMARLW